MEFDTVSASKYSLPELVNLLNRGFEDYVVPIRFSADMFANMLRKDGIDLNDSRVLIADDQACGIALIACRPTRRTSRVAAMGIAKEMRAQRAGTWFMDRLIKDGLQRDDCELVLEVIEQNEPAVRLYRNAGFESIRRLVGFICKNKEAHEKSNLYEIEMAEMEYLLSQHGLSDLPWQLSGESIARMSPPPHAFRKGQAYAVVSNLRSEHVVIWSLLVEQKARGHGLGTDMLKTLMASYAGKTWHVPAIFPEEFSKVFERAGFEKEALSQWQMKLKLQPPNRHASGVS